MSGSFGWPAGDPGPVLAQTLERAKRNRWYDIGYPGATDQTFPELSELLTSQLFNNVGDPWDAGHGKNHTKDVEQQVIGMVGDLIGAPATRWGYITSGSSEAIAHAIDAAWQAYRDVVVYTSAAAHYSVTKAARHQGVPLVIVRAKPNGEMDLDDLAGEVARRREYPVMVVATAGTTMTEAIDDVGGITAVLDDFEITRRRIHVDAALSGIPLALLPENKHPEFRFFDVGADSWSVSGHKHPGTLHPNALSIHRKFPFRAGVDRPSYTGSMDTTLFTSRSGHAPLFWHTFLTRLGTQGLRERAGAAVDMACYTQQQLERIGWPATRNTHAVTVVLPIPPAVIRDKWVLADDGGRWAHVVCVPGVVKGQIDEFISDLSKVKPPPVPAPRETRWSWRSSGVAPIIASAPVPVPVSSVNGSRSAH
jgi:histidine decarboxylase